MERMLEDINFYLDLDNEKIDEEAIQCLTKECCEKYIIFPYKIQENVLCLATTRPLDKSEVNKLRFKVKKEINYFIADKSQIINFINYYYEKDYTNKVLQELKCEKISSKNSSDEEKDKTKLLSGPVINLVDSIIFNGVAKGASDIHIEPFKNNIFVRFRVDGELEEFNVYPKSIYDAVTTRIKIISRMNITIKYSPQDGKFSKVINENEYDFRVSSLPTINGEKFVIRVLHRNDTALTLSNLGFTPKGCNLLEELLKNRQGLILITGPTGSGKTTTLYSMLKEINTVNRNLVTVEEPVEYHLEGINQVQVNNQSGLTFANTLRTILRQDPDVIMVGEIIDEATAETAIRAALTGHLVLTTLHTNDAASTINRLVDMNIPTYLISDSILAVVAQRLARRICNYCKESYKPNSSERLILNLNEKQQLHRGAGCVKCNGTGYKGRIVAYEIMLINENHRRIICSSHNSEDLRKYSINNGMIPLRDYFRQLVTNGDTTVEEYLCNLQEFNLKQFMEANYAV